MTNVSVVSLASALSVIVSVIVTVAGYLCV